MAFLDHLTLGRLDFGCAPGILGSDIKMFDLDPKDLRPMMNESLDIWKEKPKWCQPWSIILFGIILVILIWSFLRIFWLNIILSILVFFWWYIFLVIAPNSYKNLDLPIDEATE